MGDLVEEDLVSEMMTTEIPVQAAAPPPPTRWGKARARFDAMAPRTRWLNLILIVLLILAIVLAFTLIGNPSTPTVAVRTVAVSRGTVTSSVTGSGNAASSLSTPVSFQTSGTVTAVNVKAGDTVTLGEVLATVDPTSSRSSLRTAQAQLDSAEAALGQAASGPTAVKKQQDQQSVTTAQQGVANANAAVTAAQNQLGLDTTSTASAVGNAQTKLGNDQASTNTSVQTARTQLQSDTTSQDTATQNAQQQLATDEKTETGAQTAYDNCTPTETTATPCTTQQQALTAAQQAVQKDQQAVTTAQEARSALIKKDQLAVTSSEQAQTATLGTDRQSITTAQQTQAATLLKDNTAIATDKQQVTSEQGMVTSAQLAAQADLHPETPDQIAQAQAQVDQAQVQVDTAQNAVDETDLKAPQAGVVLAVNGKVGESSSGGSSGSTSTGTTGSSGSAASAASASTTSAGSAFITIANLSQLAVTANIAEADAAKVKLGQPATITFPATNTTATGSVTQITPQSTVANNVVLYPIQVSLDSAPTGVGVGSTASLSITAGSATDVLEAPNLAITSLGTRHTVTVRRDGSDTVVPVTLGLAGDTETEIVSGVGQGDMLVLPSPTAGATTGTGTGAGFPRTGG